MITFLAILKNIYERTLPRIIPYIVITLISMGSIFLGTYLSNKTQQFSHIAVIGSNEELDSITSSALVKVTHLDKKPPLSDLYEQKYDVYLYTDSSGSLQIETLKNTEYQQLLNSLLLNPDTTLSGSYAQRSTGVSIVGFMLMFLLMISYSNMGYFADDKELGQLSRIFAAPVSFFLYILANLLYSLSMFAPQFLFLVVMKLLGIHIGFTLPEFLLFILVIGFLGSSFSLLLYTMINKPDNANMLGNSIAVLTSVLAGSFYAFSGNNKILDTITKAIPQKQILWFAENIESIHHFTDILPLLYVLLFSSALFTVSCIILQKKYVKCT